MTPALRPGTTHSSLRKELVAGLEWIGVDGLLSRVLLQTTNKSCTMEDEKDVIDSIKPTRSPIIAADQSNESFNQLIKTKSLSHLS